jgi:lipopolysaccharide export system protein LptC
MGHKYSIISVMGLLILGATSLTAYFSWHPKTPRSIQSSQQADAVMENVSAIIMDKQGKPSMKIVSPKMIHFAANDTTQLVEPELTLYRKSPKPWYIRAKHGQATAGIDKVNFWDNVTIHHAADENNPVTFIKTPTLTVHPDKQIALTKDLITLIQPNLIVKATGMYADMNTGDIKLISQARGEYVPNS